MAFQGCAGAAASRRPVSGKLRRGDFKPEFRAQRGELHRCGAHLAYRATLARALVEGEYLLATTRRGDGRGDGGQLEMAQDTRNH
jgi:hypothetical protein